MKRPRKGSKARVRVTRLGQEREEIVAAIHQAYDIDRFDCEMPADRLPKRNPTERKPAKRRKGD